MLGFFRLFRTVQLNRLVGVVFKEIEMTNSWRITKIIFLYFLLIHWSSCLFYMVEEFQPRGDRWVDTLERNSVESNATFAADYSTVTYHAFLMLVGENIEPDTSAERWYGLCGALTTSIL
jgi:hypothetical protein